MHINPPFGYSEVVPLQRTDRVLLPHGATPEFCRRVNAIAVSWSELVPAARDYPIVFAGHADGTTAGFAPVAVLGLADGQNVYVAEGGEWEPGTYVPAFVRRYPFCVARIATEGGQRTEQMVCVEKAYVDHQGIALYDDEGKATPQWQGYEQLLKEYEQDLELTQQMSAILAKLDLLVPFQFQVMQENTAAFTLQGMLRVDEQRLADLKPAHHKALVTKGVMGRIFAHLHSLDNFSRLYQRALARAEADDRRRRESYQR